MSTQPSSPAITFRNYDPQKDKDAVHRIWLETGWIEKGQEEAMDRFVESGQAIVAQVNGTAECLVNTAPGFIRYLEEDLPFSCVTAVTTSRVARKRGLAGRLTALAVATDAVAGALVSGLGMFEQGYYNQLGFGNGGYEHIVSFDPSRIKIGVRARVPRRITADDWEIVHASRLVRHRAHGSCILSPPEITRAEMLWSKNGFGLGYCDGPGGELTHHLWIGVKNVEQGPYSVRWISFQTWDHFLELMALIKSLGDQVLLVRMTEPSGIQFQDLVEQPLKQWDVTKRSKFEYKIESLAFWQMRICDLMKCMARTHLRREEVRFNLRLADPIERFLDEGSPWRGLSGDYVVTLGPSSGAEPGMDSSLPMLKTSVGTFTRLWLGVRPATGLAVTDDLSGPPGLLEQLDWALRLPEPKPDWDF